MLHESALELVQPAVLRQALDGSNGFPFELNGEKKTCTSGLAVYQYRASSAHSVLAP